MQIMILALAISSIQGTKSEEAPKLENIFFTTDVIVPFKMKGRFALGKDVSEGRSYAGERLFYISGKHADFAKNVRKESVIVGISNSEEALSLVRLGSWPTLVLPFFGKDSNDWQIEIVKNSDWIKQAKAFGLKNDDASRRWNGGMMGVIADSDYERYFSSSLKIIRDKSGYTISRPLAIFTNDIYKHDFQVVLRTEFVNKAGNITLISSDILFDKSPVKLSWYISK